MIPTSSESFPQSCCLLVCLQNIRTLVIGGLGQWVLGRLGDTLGPYDHSIRMVSYVCEAEYLPNLWSQVKVCLILWGFNVHHKRLTDRITGSERQLSSSTIFPWLTIFFFSGKSLQNSNQQKIHCFSSKNGKLLRRWNTNFQLSRPQQFNKSWWQVLSSRHPSQF